ncbi:MAG: hypothetical protein RR747_06940 [Gordonibacter sp.]
MSLLWGKTSEPDHAGERQGKALREDPIVQEVEQGFLMRPEEIAEEEVDAEHRREAEREERWRD